MKETYGIAVEPAKNCNLQVQHGDGKLETSDIDIESLTYLI